MAYNQDLGEVKAKWGWIQFQEKVRSSYSSDSSNSWIDYEEDHRNGTNYGFGIRVKVEPKNTLPNCEFGRDGLYLHNEIEFLISLLSSDKTDDVDLRLCYIPKSSEERDRFIQELKQDSSQTAIYESFKYGCKSYVWMFDICLVKMVFRDRMDKTRAITKHFHLESTTGNCGYERENHFSWGPSKDELAHFKKSGFLSKSEMRSLIGFDMNYGSSSDEFPDFEFEFRARLELRPLKYDWEVLESDKNCILTESDLNPGQKMIESEKLAVKDFFSNRKRKFFEMDSDISFEVKSTTLDAHSWILAAGSPVFFKMLATDMLEQKTGIIKLEDNTTPESLKIFLTHLYRSKGYKYSDGPADQNPKSDFSYVDDWTAEISFGVLQLAHKYQVSELIDFCFENIISRPDSEFTMVLAVQIFKAGMLYEMEDLKCRCVEWIKRQTKQVKMELKELLSEESAGISCEFAVYLA